MDVDDRFDYVLNDRIPNISTGGYTHPLLEDPVKATRKSNPTSLTVANFFSTLGDQFISPEYEVLGSRFVRAENFKQEDQQGT